MSDDESILLTTDGLGKEAKRAALARIIARERADADVLAAWIQGDVVHSSPRSVREALQRVGLRQKRED